MFLADPQCMMYLTSGKFTSMLRAELATTILFPPSPLNDSTTSALYFLKKKPPFLMCTCQSRVKSCAICRLTYPQNFFARRVVEMIVVPKSIVWLVEAMYQSAF